MLGSTAKSPDQSGKANGLARVVDMGMGVRRTTCRRWAAGWPASEFTRDRGDSRIGQKGGWDSLGTF